MTQTNLFSSKPYGSTRATSISLKELTVIEAYLIDEIAARERLTKKMNRFNTISSLIDADLITSTVFTGGVSIATFATYVSVSVGIALSRNSLF